MKKSPFFVVLLVIMLFCAVACLLTACSSVGEEQGGDSQDISVVSFEKTGSEGKVDTYKITYSDGTSTTFTVTNGTDGIDGIDGVGISEVRKTSSVGLVDTYTIFFTDGSTATFTVTNGNSVTDEITIDDAFAYYPLDDGTLGIGAGNTKYLSSVSIPSEYRGKIVTRIVGDAFSNFSNLQEVAIPDTIKYVDERAFYQCNALTTVSIPDSVVQIGDDAFYGCSNLQTVAIGNKVTVLGDRVFSGCTALTAVSIPDSVVQIGDGVFSDCTSLQSVELGQGLENVGLYVFNGCSSLKTINVEQGNSKYASGDGYVYDNTGCLVFYCYGKLAKSQTLILADGITKIDDGIFYEGLNYEFTFGEIVLPDSLVEIEKNNGALIFALAESDYSSQWHINTADSTVSSSVPDIDGWSLNQLWDAYTSSLLSMLIEFCNFYRVI